VPIYEYECDSCNFRFEKKQRFDAKPETACPKCQGLAHRVFHPAPVIFKGSGFYVTDNRKASDIESEKGKDKPPEKTPEKPPDKKEPEGEQG